MFALIFMWTPPHFWALALFVKTDYGDAGVPMLTETHGRRATRNHILAYSLLLVPVALALGFTSIGGPVYLAAAVVLNARFLRGAWRVWRRDEAAAEADSYRPRSGCSSCRCATCSCISARCWSRRAARRWGACDGAAGRTRTARAAGGPQHRRRADARRASSRWSSALTVVKVLNSATSARSRASTTSPARARAGARAAGEEGRMKPFAEPGPQRTLAAMAASVVVVMGALAWASVPFYSWFCRVTGFGGDHRRGRGGVATRSSTGRSPSASTPRSTATCRGTFRPVQREMTLRIGETGLAFYEAHNPTDRPDRRAGRLQRRALFRGRLLRQDRMLLLHRAGAAAGRDGADAGQLLRRSGDRRRPRGEVRPRRSRWATPSTRSTCPRTSRPALSSAPRL